MMNLLEKFKESVGMRVPVMGKIPRFYLDDETFAQVVKWKNGEDHKAIEAVRAESDAKTFQRKTMEGTQPYTGSIRADVTYLFRRTPEGLTLKVQHNATSASLDLHLSETPAPGSASHDEQYCPQFLEFSPFWEERRKVLRWLIKQEAKARRLVVNGSEAARLALDSPSEHRLTYIFTPTSLGTTYKLRHEATLQEEDFTDYLSW